MLREIYVFKVSTLVDALGEHSRKSKPTRASIVYLSTTNTGRRNSGREGWK